MSAAQPANANIQPRQGETINLDRHMAKLRFSPCGRFMVAGGCDATVRRWEVTDAGFTAIAPLTGHHGWIQAVAFHPDRRRLLTADSWGELRIWSYADAQPNCLRTVANAHDGWIRDLAVSADGRHFATCGRDQKVAIWSLAADNNEPRKVHEIAGHNDDVYSVAFHPDNRTLVSGDLHGNVKQWDVATGRKTRDFAACPSLYRLSGIKEQGGVRCLVFDPTGRTLAIAGGRPGSTGGSPTIYLHDVASARLQHTIAIEDAQAGLIFDLAFHASGFVMAVASGTPGKGTFFLQRPGEQAPFFTNTRMANCHSLAVHPTNNRVVVAATNTGSNGNGRNLRGGVYAGNFSPLYVWTLPS